MTKVRIHMMMSLDGRAAGPNMTPDRPFGDGTEGFTDWVFELKSFRAQHGMEGGVEGPGDDVMAETSKNLGATIMGRNMFGGGPGPWGDKRWGADPWKGWWGPNPPYHTPVFVLTHHPREPLQMEGGTTFHFVTDGIASALQQAKAAAGDKDIRIGGGANVANQFLAAGLVDEVEIHLVPMVIGAGPRLFDGLADPLPGFELVRTVAAPDVTHVKYRVLR